MFRKSFADCVPPQTKFNNSGMKKVLNFILFCLSYSPYFFIFYYFDSFFNSVDTCIQFIHKQECYIILSLFDVLISKVRFRIFFNAVFRKSFEVCEPPHVKSNHLEMQKFLIYFYSSTCCTIQFCFSFYSFHSFVYSVDTCIQFTHKYECYILLFFDV